MEKRKNKVPKEKNIPVIKPKKELGGEWRYSKSKSFRFRKSTTNQTNTAEKMKKKRIYRKKTVLAMEAEKNELVIPDKNPDPAKPKEAEKDPGEIYSIPIEEPDKANQEKLNLNQETI